MTTLHSPAQAAKIAGVSRSKVSRALKDGKLRGTRNNAGHWKIPDDALREWMDVQPHNVPAQAKDHPDTARVAVLEAENRMLKERVEELRTERDDWKAQASRRWWDFFRR